MENQYPNIENKEKQFFMNLGDRAMKNEPKMPPVAIKWIHIVLSLQKLLDILSLRRRQGTAEQDINDVIPSNLSIYFFQKQGIIKMHS